MDELNIHSSCISQSPGVPDLEEWRLHDALPRPWGHSSYLIPLRSFQVVSVTRGYDNGRELLVFVFLVWNVY